MDNQFALISTNMLKQQTAVELRGCNEYTERFGLRLTEEQIQNLVEKRFQALSYAGRVEFGEGIVKKLIVVFCDSPYISSGNYEETISDLQDTFYHFKNASKDMITDDDLIDFIRKHFDTVCEGSIELLNDATLEELLHNKRRASKVQNKDLGEDLRD